MNLANTPATKTPINSTNRAIKATLYHLNGKTSEIVIITPIYTGWAEPCEDAARHLDEYVKELTRFWVQITHFTVSVGSIMSNGSFEETFNYQKQEVPEGKIYLHGSRGKWVTPEELKAAELLEEQAYYGKGGMSCEG